ISTRDRILERCSGTELRKAKLLVPEKTETLRALCISGGNSLGCDLSVPAYSSRLDRELALIEEKNFEDYFFVLHDLMQFARSRMLCGPGRGSSAGSLVCYLLGITTVDSIEHGLMFERFLDPSRNDMPDVDLDVPDDRRDELFRYLENKYGK